MTNEPENQKLPSKDSALEGHFLSILVFPWPWPPASRQKWVQKEALTIFAETTGHLTVEITAQTQVCKFTSCRLIVSHGQTTTNVGVSWKLPELVNMIVGKTFVISTEDASVVPSETTVISGVPGGERNFSEENAKKLKKRHDTLAGSQPVPGRRRGGKEEAFEALRQEYQQITELLKLIDQGGGTDNVPGLLSRIRMVIAQGRPMPLLQLCAAMIDEPLIVYVPPITADRKPQEGAGDSFVYAISLVATDLTKNAADLDLWLDSRAAQYDEKIHSQREVINHLGNTIGSHFDLDIHPTVEMLRSWRTGIDGVDLNFLVRYACTLGYITKELISHVLAKKGS
jgi:hypothetical protein